MSWNEKSSGGFNINLEIPEIMVKMIKNEKMKGTLFFSIFNV